jgi:regulatory protein YycI of two-component signal transduction system YycFG
MASEIHARASDARVLTSYYSGMSSLPSLLNSQFMYNCFLLFSPFLISKYFMRKTDTEVRRMCVGESLSYNLKFNNKMKKRNIKEKRKVGYCVQLTSQSYNNLKNEDLRDMKMFYTANAGLFPILC